MLMNHGKCYINSRYHDWYTITYNTEKCLTAIKVMIGAIICQYDSVDTLIFDPEISKV